MTGSKDVLQTVDGDARRLAQTLLRTARFAALGTIDPRDGSPSVSRVSLATAMDGTPGFLISRLSSHFTNLEVDARCSLLVGEPGKGDPLAHPRMTLIGGARCLSRESAECSAFAHRYLLRHPKASLYAGFADFSFWSVGVSRASLNGGFGKAYALAPGDLVTTSPVLAGLQLLEADAIEHMNGEHQRAVDQYAHIAGGDGHGWKLAGIDPDGLDLVRGDHCIRLWFEAPLMDVNALRPTLVKLTEQR